MKVIDYDEGQLRRIGPLLKGGAALDIESFTPYLCNYRDMESLTEQGLVKEDKVGLALVELFSSLFPKARIVSLLDDYNADTHGTKVHDKKGIFTKPEKSRFKKGVGQLVVSRTNNKVLLLSESEAATKGATRMVNRLNVAGYIKEKGDELYFVNKDPMTKVGEFFRLRKGAYWYCAALDASFYLKRENRKLIHLIILPDYLKVQQEKVREIVKALGVPMGNYVNIFFKANAPEEAIIKEIRELLHEVN